METDFLVEVTGDPAAVDQTLNQIGAVLVGGGMPGGYVKVDGYFLMRALGNPGFVKFACESQGYCRVVKQLEKPE